MSWSTKTILPTRPDQEPRRVILPSPPLARFLGAVGFSAAGLGTLTLGTRIMGIGSGMLSSATWSGEFVVVFISSLIAALIGGFVGLVIGINIKVSNDRLDYSINVLWHYLANGILIWGGLMGLAMTKTYGKEGMKQLVAQVGVWRISIYALGICSIGCLLIGIVLSLAGLLKEGHKPRMALCLAVSVPIALAMAYVQFALLGIASRDWIIIGVVFPVVLILVSAYMINRDREQRNQIVRQ